MKLNLPKLILAVALCEVVGNLPIPLTISAIPTWYTTLNKPFFSPPNWVFGPVWTILFLLMGISLYLVISHKSQRSRKIKALWFFGIQLVLNVLWSIIFFGIRNPTLALVEVVILWVMILLTILEFRKISKLAAYLLIPYLLWVSFATFLNWAIVGLN